MNQKEKVLDSAVSVTAALGAKGLTHRAVDAHAGLPTGSTSNHFRTRRQLVEAVVARLLELDALRLTALARAPHESLGAFASAFIVETLNVAGESVAARVALLSDPDAGSLRSARDRLLELGAGSPLLAELPQTTLRMVLNFVDGTLQDATLYGATINPADLTAAVDGILGAARMAHPSAARP